MADEELPFQTVEGPNSTWVEIATAQTEEDAKLLQLFLEGEGIPCQIESLRFDMAPVNFGRLGEVRIYVTAENEAAAQQLLADRDREYDATSAESEQVITDEGPANIEDDAQTVAETEE
jgi:hypothetical protein